MQDITEWLSGSGGVRETPSHFRAISEKVMLAERQSLCPLEPVLGGPYAYKDSTPVDLIDGG